MSAHAERRRDRTNAAPQWTGAVHLHIDRLVLHGITQADAPRLASAMEGELATLAAQPAPRFESLAAASLPTPRIATGRTPMHIGRAAAGAVWSSLTASGVPE